MSILATFGSESRMRKQKRIAEEIIAEGHETSGVITAVKTCWWIKINTNPFRCNTLDGAKFPHIIYYAYHVNGRAYQGSKCAGCYLRRPGEGETVTIFYDKNDPARTAVSLGSVLLLC